MSSALEYKAKTHRPLKLLELKRILWPDIVFYDKQIETIESVERDDETVVVAGNQLGKDFVAGFVVLTFFLTRHPCRILTTSVKADHLNVLWGEIGEWIRLSKYPLSADRGGPLITYRGHGVRLRKIVDGEMCSLSYVMSVVASPDTVESFQGHHVKPPAGQADDGIARNMFVCDEASGVNDDYYKMADTWARRKLIFGNPWQCNNFFYRAVKGNPETKDPGGDLVDDIEPNRYLRKVIQMGAEASPNVKLGLIQEKAGVKPNNRVLIPGLVTYKTYKNRLKRLDKILQCVSLHGQFYEGAQNLLYPPEWLNAANDLGDNCNGKPSGKRYMGVDTAEGGDKTVWLVIDDYGVLDILSLSTPDTSMIGGQTLALKDQYGIDDSNILFDTGGGGREHADYLRRQGHKRIRTVAFGGSATAPKTRTMKSIPQREIEEETRFTYKNRRAEMYHLVSLRLNPDWEGQLAIPRKYTELRRQLAPVPRLYDGEGRMYLPPKQKKNATDTTETMRDLIGCSPDEADALALAVFGSTGRGRKVTIGGMRFK